MEVESKKPKCIGLPVVWNNVGNNEDEKEAERIKRLISGDVEDNEQVDITKLPIKTCYFFKVDVVAPYFDDERYSVIEVGGSPFTIKASVEVVLDAIAHLYT